MTPKDMIIDEHFLKTLVPFNRLNSSLIRELAQKSRIDSITSGRYVFKQGGTDNESAYIISGEVELRGESGDSIDNIKAGTEEATYALAPGQPRPLSARAVSDARFIRINRDLLDLMLSWDPTTRSSISVTEVERGEEEATVHRHPIYHTNGASMPSFWEADCSK